MLLLSLALVAGAYTAARLASASIVAYVVEETLVQKAPPGIDPISIRQRFHAMLSAAPGKAARLDRLLSMAQALEKAQQLTVPEFEQLLEIK